MSAAATATRQSRFEEFHAAHGKKSWAPFFIASMSAIMRDSSAGEFRVLMHAIRNSWGHQDGPRNYACDRAGNPYTQKTIAHELSISQSRMSEHMHSLTQKNYLNVKENHIYPNDDPAAAPPPAPAEPAAVPVPMRTFEKYCSLLEQTEYAAEIALYKADIVKHQEEGARLKDRRLKIINAGRQAERELRRETREEFDAKHEAEGEEIANELTRYRTEINGEDKAKQNQRTGILADFTSERTPETVRSVQPEVFGTSGTYEGDNLITSETENIHTSSSSGLSVEERTEHRTPTTTTTTDPYKTYIPEEHETEREKPSLEGRKAPSPPQAEQDAIGEALSLCAGKIVDSRAKRELWRGCKDVAPAVTTADIIAAISEKAELIANAQNPVGFALTAIPELLKDGGIARLRQRATRPTAAAPEAPPEFADPFLLLTAEELEINIQDWKKLLERPKNALEREHALEQIARHEARLKELRE